MRNLLITILFFTSFHVYGQNFAPVEKFLIDSLDLQVISEPDKALLDSILPIFHECLTDSCRILAISVLVESSWDEAVWPKYNRWLRDFLVRKINELKDTSNARFIKKAYAGTLNNIGYWYNNQGDMDLAINYYTKTLQIQKEIDDQPGMSGTMINMGYIYLNRGLIEKALECYYESLKIEEETQNQSGIATALNAIGFIQYKQNDEENALKSYESSLKIRREIHDDYGTATCLNNIGIIYKDQKQWKKALEYYSECLELQERIADKQGIAISLGNIGFIYSSLEQRDKALKFFERSRILYEKLNNQAGLAQTYDHIAEVYLLKNDLIEANKFALRSLEISQQLNFPSQIRDAAKTLSQIAEGQRKWKRAHEYYKLYIQMRDSVFNEETINASIHQQYKYAYEKKLLADSIENANLQRIKNAELSASNAERDRLELLNSQKQRESYFLIIIIVSALFYIALIYNRMKTIRRHQKIIEEKNEILKSQKESIENQNRELADLNKDLKEFAHIVSHDLKTPLHIIISAVHLIEMDISDVEPEIHQSLDMIKESSQTANELIDGILAYSEAGHSPSNLEEVDIGDLVKKVLENLNNEKNASIQVNGEMPKVKCNTTQFKQILMNLLNNALKYNDKEKGDGKITISSRSYNGSHEFSIQDNGPGIPKKLQHDIFNIFWRSHHIDQSDSTGIGLSIVKKLVTKNGGEIWVDSEPGKGACFKFTWPKML